MTHEAYPVMDQLNEAIARTILHFSERCAALEATNAELLAKVIQHESCLNVIAPKVDQLLAGEAGQVSADQFVGFRDKVNQKLADLDENVDDLYRKCDTLGERIDDTDYMDEIERNLQRQVDVLERRLDSMPGGSDEETYVTIESFEEFEKDFEYIKADVRELEEDRDTFKDKLYDLEQDSGKHGRRVEEAHARIDDLDCEYEEKILGNYNTLKEMIDELHDNRGVVTTAELQQKFIEFNDRMLKIYGDTTKHANDAFEMAMKATHVVSQFDDRTAEALNKARDAHTAAMAAKGSVITMRALLSKELGAVAARIQPHEPKPYDESDPI